MKINKRREELKESIKEAKRTWRKIVRIKKYGGKKNEKQKRSKCYRTCRRFIAS